MSLNPGDRLDRFEVLGRLGAGGMGAVYRARAPADGEEVALKVLESPDPELRARFQREGRAMVAVKHHPHVVDIHHCGEWGDRIYLAMALAPGGDLEQRLAGGPLPPPEAARLVIDLAHGLAHAHRNGVLHRDLKPQNVVFDGDGRPMLTDFGLAKVVGAETLTRTGTALGTPAYMAPEQAQGEPVDERTDVYGLGAVLYHCLTGRAPVERGAVLQMLMKVAEGRIEPPRSVRAEIPAAFEVVCLRAMALRPEDRFESAEALARGLEAALGAPAPPQARAPLPVLLLGLVVVVVVLATVLLVAFAVRAFVTDREARPADPPPRRSRSRRRRFRRGRSRLPSPRRTRPGWRVASTMRSGPCAARCGGAPRRVDCGIA